MTPRTLVEWNSDAVVDIMLKGYFETEDFDLKERLPDPRDEKGKERLRCACAAFANSSGGFLVFGISDDRGLDPRTRLKGLDPAFDFPEQFGNYPHLCVPGVDWSFRNPPIMLPSGNVIHVVHVPRSWKAPHAIATPDRAWLFPKRTNKGNERMSMEEIRAAFLGFYEKRMRLQLLQAELAGLREIAKSAIIHESADTGETYSLVTFEITVIESIIADTYPLTATVPELLAALRELRSEVSVANNKARIAFSSIGMGRRDPLVGQNQLVRHHNKFMADKCTRIEGLCDRAITSLSKLVAA